MQPPSRCLVLLTGIAGAGKRSHSSARRRATTRPSGRSSYQPSRSVTDRTIALAPRGIPLARDSIGVASVGARLLAGERARAVADEVGISLRTAERIRERALLVRRRVSHSPHRLPFEERERIIVGIAAGGPMGRSPRRQPGRAGPVAAPVAKPGPPCQTHHQCCDDHLSPSSLRGPAHLPQ